MFQGEPLGHELIDLFEWEWNQVFTGFYQWVMDTTGLGHHRAEEQAQVGVGAVDADGVIMGAGGIDHPLADHAAEIELDLHHQGGDQLVEGGTGLVAEGDIHGLSLSSCYRNIIVRDPNYLEAGHGINHRIKTRTTAGLTGGADIVK